MLEKVWSKRNSHPLLLGLKTCTTTLEISMVFLRKLGVNQPKDPAIPTLGYIPKKMLNHTTKGFVQLCL